MLVSIAVNSIMGKLDCSCLYTENTKPEVNK